ncbi:MAG TPA: RdgB/HAM1 family non-canonical purine NTP pyrophosphatase [Dongiaceae bacterium]|jgi:XTP/dITP diphosphohydrolase|nr:RdgB/HAM1 family non-canonical purine NTP pyrophosphatase [Dongiaceae bacterium]
MALVVASHNRGKAQELIDLLAPLGFRLALAGDLGLPEPEETGNTFAENALLKARAAASLARVPAIGDDSGLAVEALAGAPGIYSARWAGAERDFSHAIQRVLDEVAQSGHPSRSCAFVCALALVTPEGEEVCVEAHAPGSLSLQPRGVLGFGYDPIFVPDGFTATFGEMQPEEKHELSHRTAAFRKLLPRLQKLAGAQS